MTQNNSVFIFVWKTSINSSGRPNFRVDMNQVTKAQCPHKKKKLDLRKLGNIRKLPKPDRLIAQRPFSPPKRKICQYYQKTLEKQNLNLSRCALFHMKTRVSVKYFVSHCLCKLLF